MLCVRSTWAASSVPFQAATADVSISVGNPFSWIVVLLVLVLKGVPTTPFALNRKPASLGLTKSASRLKIVSLFRLLLSEESSLEGPPPRVPDKRSLMPPGRVAAGKMPLPELRWLPGGERAKLPKGVSAVGLHPIKN